MATEKQCEANRRNALLSTGPKTPEGKEIVRLDAVKHGLRADLFVLAPGENPDEFDNRLAGYNLTYAPANEVAANLVRLVAVISWQIDRAVRFENAALSRRVHDAVMACDCDDNDVEALTQAAGLAFFDSSKEGDKLRRYQFALQRDMHRIMVDLAKLGELTAAESERIIRRDRSQLCSAWVSRPRRNRGLCSVWVSRPRRNRRPEVSGFWAGR